MVRDVCNLLDEKRIAKCCVQSFQHKCRQIVARSFKEAQIPLSVSSSHETGCFSSYTIYSWAET